MEINQSKSAASAKGFLHQVIKPASFNIKALLTDDDKVFTDRVIGQGSRTPTGDHLFDQLCAPHAVDHWLIPIRRPQNNGIAERFNGRIAEILGRSQFKSEEELSQTLRRFGYLYSQQIAGTPSAYLSTQSVANFPFTIVQQTG